MERFKGIIALDIDGTITQKKFDVDPNLLFYLQNLYENKWQCVFVTGRSFSFAEPIISSLSVPFFLVVQNGCAIFSVPEKKLLFSEVLKKEVINYWLVAAKKSKVALVLELYKKNSDVILYDPSSMTKEERTYIEYRRSFFRGEWIACDLLSYPFENFLLAKVFGNDDALKQFSTLIDHELIESVFMRDPFRQDGHFFFLHSKLASKKNGILFLQKELFPDTKLIVAGDDLNDLSLLNIADYAIVMSHAPNALKERADIIIEPKQLQDALEKGIQSL